MKTYIKLDELMSKAHDCNCFLVGNDVYAGDAETIAKAYLSESPSSAFEEWLIYNGLRIGSYPTTNMMDVSKKGLSVELK